MICAVTKDETHMLHSQLHSCATKMNKWKPEEEHMNV